MERKFSHIILVCSIILAVCLAFGWSALYMYRTYRAAESYYEAYLDGLKTDKPREVTEFFSAELKNLWDKADGVPDWDLFLLAQDWDDPSFEILSVNGNSKEAEVAVKVRNFGIEKINTLRMVREGDCYLIDNFIADGYNLKELLTTHSTDSDRVHNKVRSTRQRIHGKNTHGEF